MFRFYFAAIFSVLLNTTVLAQTPNSQPSSPSGAFPFANGAVVYFDSSRGVHFRKPKFVEADFVYRFPIQFFEPAGSKPTDVTFFANQEGLFLINDQGEIRHLRQFAGKESIEYVPHRNLIDENGRRFRTFLIRAPEADGYRVWLMIFAADLNARWIEMSGIPSLTTSLRGGVTIVKGLHNETIFKMQILADELETPRLVEQSFFGSDWKDSDPFARFRERGIPHQLYLNFSDLRHYRPLVAQGSLTADQQQVARTQLSYLYGMSDLGRAAILKLREDEVQPLVNIVIAQKVHGRVAGAIEYRPLQSGDNAAVDKWLEEKILFQRASRENGLVLIVREPGQTRAIFVPRGLKGELLEASLSACNLAFQ